VGWDLCGVGSRMSLEVGLFLGYGSGWHAIMTLVFETSVF
jgi:hypothetical protein